METFELKTNIFQLIDKLEDTDILNAINNLLEKQFAKQNTQDFWNDLPQNTVLTTDDVIRRAKISESNILNHEFSSVEDLERESEKW